MGEAIKLLRVLADYGYMVTDAVPVPPNDLPDMATALQATALPRCKVVQPPWIVHINDPILSLF